MNSFIYLLFRKDYSLLCSLYYYTHLLFKFGQLQLYQIYIILQMKKNHVKV
jgi:hypothetical protein